MKIDELLRRRSGLYESKKPDWFAELNPDWRAKADEEAAVIRATIPLQDMIETEAESYLRAHRDGFNPSIHPYIDFVATQYAIPRERVRRALARAIEAKLRQRS